MSCVLCTVRKMDGSLRGRERRGTEMNDRNNQTKFPSIWVMRGGIGKCDKQRDAEGGTVNPHVGGDCAATQL